VRNPPANNPQEKLTLPIESGSNRGSLALRAGRAYDKNPGPVLMFAKQVKAK